MKLNHLHLNVPDVKKARAFYEDFLGFKVLFEHGEGVFLQDADGFQLALDPLKNGEDAANFYCWAPGPYQLEVSWHREG